MQVTRSYTRSGILEHEPVVMLRSYQPIMKSQSGILQLICAKRMHVESKINFFLFIVHRLPKRVIMARSDEAAAFTYAVYSAVREIPHGKVTSYGHIAKLVGTRMIALSHKILSSCLRVGIDPTPITN